MLGSQPPGREGRVLFLLFRRGKERGSQDTELLLLPSSPGIGNAMSQKFLINLQPDTVHLRTGKRERQWIPFPERTPSSWSLARKTPGPGCQGGRAQGTGSQLIQSACLPWHLRQQLCPLTFNSWEWRVEATLAIRTNYMQSDWTSSLLGFGLVTCTLLCLQPPGLWPWSPSEAGKKGRQECFAWEAPNSPVSWISWSQRNLWEVTPIKPLRDPQMEAVSTCSHPAQALHPLSPPPALIRTC